MIFFKNTVIDSQGKVIEFQAFEGELLLGECTLILGEKFAEVTKLSYTDNLRYAAEGLLKSAYNYAALKNFYMAKCSVKGIENLLLSIGFENKDNEYITDIPTILMGSCGCCGGK